jgi:hypothetical protein
MSFAIQLHSVVWAVIPGPASVALTLPAAASDAATDALIGVVEEEETVSMNLTGIVEPAFTGPFAGSGDKNPPKP